MVYGKIYGNFFFFLEQRATTETEIFLQVIVACYFLPFCLFLFTYIWPERIDSVADLRYATVLLQEPITRLGSITRRACMRDEGSG